MHTQIYGGGGVLVKISHEHCFFNISGYGIFPICIPQGRVWEEQQWSQKTEKSSLWKTQIISNCEISIKISPSLWPRVIPPQIMLTRSMLRSNFPLPQYHVHSNSALTVSKTWLRCIMMGSKSDINIMHFWYKNHRFHLFLCTKSLMMKWVGVY